MSLSFSASARSHQNQRLSPTMENEESLIHILSRLSFIIEQSMSQKRSVEKELKETREKVKMLTQANDTLMKHVVSLEKRNDIVTQGLAKVVETVDYNCQRIKEDARNSFEKSSRGRDSFPIGEQISNKKEHLDVEDSPRVQNAKGSYTNPVSESVTTPVEDKIGEPILSSGIGELGLEEEPESAELRSIIEQPVDPLEYSNIMDYTAELDDMPAHNGRKTGSRLRSGLWRSGKLSSSGRLFRGRRMRSSYVGCTTSAENRRRRGNGGVKDGASAAPKPKAECGCILHSIFGCRE